jgi:hypothetical protein
MRARTTTVIALLAALATSPAMAQAPRTTASAAASESSVTLYAGYRAGGEFTDVTTGKGWELTDGASYAVAIDIGINHQSQWEVFISHRRTALQASGFFSPLADNIGLDVTYYHFGGTYFPGQVGNGFYVVGGLGVTHFSPQDSRFSSETKPSLNLGLGYLIPLGKHLGIKLEARGYGTLINNSGGMFCSGGCVVQIKGDTITQGEVLAGFSARF